MRTWAASTALGVAVILLALGLAYRSQASDLPLAQIEAAFSIPSALLEPAMQAPIADVAAPSSTAWRAHFMHETRPIEHERAVRVPVLMYHQIRTQKPNADRVDRLMTVSPESFAQQMKELVDGGYTSITPDELKAALDGGVLPPKPVLITFDDGYRTQYENAYPVLKAYGLNATFFIVSGYVGRPAYMSQAMIQDMLDQGIATVGAHTVSHRGLVDAPPQDRKHELVDAKAALEVMFHIPVTTMAYPYGNHDESVIEDTLTDGYDTAYSTFLGSVHTSSSRMELRRIRVNDGEPMGALLDYFSK